MINTIGQLEYMKYVCLRHEYECKQFLRYFTKQIVDLLLMCIVELRMCTNPWEFLRTPENYKIVHFSLILKKLPCGSAYTTALARCVSE